MCYDDKHKNLWKWVDQESEKWLDQDWIFWIISQSNTKELEFMYIILITHKARLDRKCMEKSNRECIWE